MINFPYCDCCSTPGQWFADHVDPHNLVQTAEDYTVDQSTVAQVNRLRVRLTDTRALTAPELQHALTQYLAQKA